MIFSPRLSSLTQSVLIHRNRLSMDSYPHIAFLTLSHNTNSRFSKSLLPLFKKKGILRKFQLKLLPLLLMLVNLLQLALIRLLKNQISLSVFLLVTHRTTHSKLVDVT